MPHPERGAAEVKRHQPDPETEATAMRVVMEHERDRGRHVDPACFPNTDPEDIPGLGDAAIVSESMALGAKLLLTSDLRSSDHIEVNRWTVDHGAEWGIRAEETLHDADLTFLNWTKTPAGLERWIQAGLLACWPSPDNAPAGEVLDSNEDGIRRMTHGDGGKLRRAGQRLLNGLRKHPDPDGLVEQTRGLLPSATVESDRRHLTYPHRPSRTRYRLSRSTRMRRHQTVRAVREVPAAVPRVRDRDRTFRSTRSLRFRPSPRRGRRSAFTATSRRRSGTGWERGCCRSSARAAISR